MDILSIGQMARRAGVGVETVRFYEPRSLLEEPAAAALLAIVSTLSRWSSDSTLSNAHKSLAFTQRDTELLMLAR